MLLFITAILLMLAENTDLQQVHRWIYEGNTEDAKAWLTDKTQNPAEADNAYVELLMNLHHQDMNYGAVAELYSRFGETVENSAVKSYLAGNALLQQGQRSRGMNLLQLSRTLDEAYVRPRLVLYRQYSEERNVEVALEIAGELTSIQPENSFFQVQLARSSAEMGQVARAIDLLEIVTQADSMYAAAHIELIRVLMLEDEAERTRERANRAKALFPDDHRIRNLSARLYYSARNFARAAREWERVIEAGQQTLQTHLNIGLCYYQLQRGDIALDHFIHVLEQEPQDLTALMYAAVIYREKDDLGRASELLDILYEAQLSDFFTDTLIQRAVVNEAKGEPRLAEADYKLAATLDPEKHVLYYYLGYLYDAKLNNREQAKQHYMRFVESGNSDPGLTSYANSRIRVIREELFFRGD